VAGLFGAGDVRAVADAALEVPGADAVEVLLMHEWGGLTRFANSSIHQSTWREDTAVRVRVVWRDRVGLTATNDFSKDGAVRAAQSALEMARVAAPDPAFPGLAPTAPTAQREGAFDEATASASPDVRAEAVADLVGRVGTGFRAAGAVETTAVEVAVANSEGQFCYAPLTQATVSSVVSGGEGGAGAAEATDGRLDNLNPAEIGARAFEKARDSQRPAEIEPGQFPVVLEPSAVATLLGFLSFMGFGGRSIDEERSPFSGKAGEAVCAPAITIADDALSPESIGLPFDFEGTPRHRVVLVEDGVFRTGVYDRRSARQAGRESTGHALPPPNPMGAFPLNLTMAAGTSTVDDMIRATDRGLLVTRFHYSNVVHPIETTLTGMTRDGTWLIENGERTRPVRNLRFTQSILGALSDVRSVGRDTELVSEFFFAASRVPALQIGSFNFSGASDH
jgi:predicted Zn-dependent protease